MKCTRTDLATELTLRIEDALDSLTTCDVAPIFDAVVADQPRRVTLDLDELTLLDSAGAGAIISLFKRVTAGGGAFVLVNAHEQPLVVLRLLELDRLFGLPA